MPDAISLEFSPFVDFMRQAGTRLYMVVASNPGAARRTVQGGGERLICPTPLRFDTKRSRQESAADIAESALDGVLVLCGAADDLLFLSMILLGGLNLPPRSKMARTSPVGFKPGMTILFFVKDGCVHFDPV